jgi:hypothetical protein
VRSFLLKTGATLLAVAATVLSSVYVTAHMKNPAAPLQPPVLDASKGATALGGTVTVSPSVQSGSAQPVTSTYAS